MSSSEALNRATENLIEWLRKRVIEDATGEGRNSLETHPAGTFWLGRLASDRAIFANANSRGDRLDPCSIGIRFRPSESGPWTLSVRVRATPWRRDRQSRVWTKCPAIDEAVAVEVAAGHGEFSVGENKLRAALRSSTGIECLSARIDISSDVLEDGSQELTVALVNTSPEESRELGDTHLYECSLTIGDCPSRRYLLEALPDSFRYDRAVVAYGLNCGVVMQENGALTTIDVPTSDRNRPAFWPIGQEQPDFSFEHLASDPQPLAGTLLNHLREWGTEHWGEHTLTRRSQDEHWDAAMLAEAKKAALEFDVECERINRGAQALKEDGSLSRAFQLMNASMLIAAHGRYHAWRPFQFGFLLANIGDLSSGKPGTEIADVVWFATGGGKTETYLGLLLTAAFYDRLRGKTCGITAWSRFPLRMLSLQQTQRFANALAAAEIVRRRQEIGGAPFSLGFFVGSGATPNTLKTDPKPDEPDPDRDDMPERFRLLDVCPFCRLQFVGNGFQPCIVDARTSL